MTTIAEIRAAEEETRKQPTDTQRATIAFITDFVATRGFPPSLKEIGDHFGITSRAADDRLKWLVRKGLVRKEPNRTRSYAVAKTVPAVPVVFGFSESVVGVLDRIERRWPYLDRAEVQTDLERAQVRIMAMLDRLRSGK